MIAGLKSSGRKPSLPSPGVAHPTFGSAREFMGNRFVYAVISRRAHGLAIGVNLNPDSYCNFDYKDCEPDRSRLTPETKFDLPVMAAELRRMLALAHSGELQNFHKYRSLPGQLMQLRHVALGGEGEPTLDPNFQEAIQTMVHVRALGEFTFFKLVLMTNASGLDLHEVQAGLKLFTARDEIWAKLEAGTGDDQQCVNHPNRPLEKILENILRVARERPVVIQSLFPRVNGREPSPEEIELYARRLHDLQRAGARIPLVQIYSAARPAPNSSGGHLPLKSLAHIARTVRRVSGLRAEVF